MTDKDDVEKTTGAEKRPREEEDVSHVEEPSEGKDR